MFISSRPTSDCVRMSSWLAHARKPDASSTVEFWNHKTGTWFAKGLVKSNPTMKQCLPLLDSHFLSDRRVTKLVYVEKELAGRGSQGVQVLLALACAPFLAGS